MTRLEEKIKVELTKRFEAADWNKLVLNMKTGDTVVIDCMEDEKGKLFDVTVLTMDAEQWTTYRDDMDALVNLIANLQDFIDGQNDSSNNIQAFYDKHLKGHTSDELRRGNDLAIEMHVAYNDTETSYAGFTANYLAEHVEYLTETYGEDYKTCFQVAEDFQHYSDWYKSLYGYRPQPFNNEGIAA